MRNFADWFSHFRESISDHAYYVDFAKVNSNVDIPNDLSLFSANEL